MAVMQPSESHGTNMAVSPRKVTEPIWQAALGKSRNQYGSHAALGKSLSQYGSHAALGKSRNQYGSHAALGKSRNQYGSHAALGKYRFCVNADVAGKQNIGRQPGAVTRCSLCEDGLSESRMLGPR